MSAQALDALAYGNAIRLAQAALFREIRALPGDEGKERVAAILRDPDELQGAIRLERLLRAINRYGLARTRKLVASVGMAPTRLNRRLRELTQRERDLLARTLLNPPTYAPGPRPSRLQLAALEVLGTDWRSSRAIAEEINSTPTGAGLALAHCEARGQVERLRDRDVTFWRKVAA